MGYIIFRFTERVRDNQKRREGCGFVLLTATNTTFKFCLWKPDRRMLHFYMYEQSHCLVCFATNICCWIRAQHGPVDWRPLLVRSRLATGISNSFPTESLIVLLRAHKGLLHKYTYIRM